MVLLLCAQLLCAALAHGDGGRASDPPFKAIFGATDVRCPFNFRDGMPPGVFCVYDGVALGAGDQACDDRVLVIWSRLASEFDAPGAPGDQVTDRSGVYYAFVPLPEMVLRATVDTGGGDRATIRDYTLGPRQPRAALTGGAELRFVAADGGEGTEVLSIRLRRPILAAGTCAVTSYDGTFVGVMTLPPDAPLEEEE
jgi:hypothetical protein